jgi:tryptophan 2,3-dioxygenase
MDRGNCGRALRAVAIAGVEPPEGPGGRWKIPRAKLTDAVAACLYRRQRRSHDRWAAGLERCRWRAAELLLDHDEGTARWRHHHALMAAREIGTRPGTGGSPGVEYLQGTVGRRFFADLWDVRLAL